jgi:hypothetical protein
MSTLLGSATPKILRWRFSAVRPSSTPPATPMVPVRTESPMVAAVLPCSSLRDPLLDALVVCPVDSLPLCSWARLREGWRLLLARRRVEPPPLARRVVPEPLLLARPLPLLRLLLPEPLPLARLLRGVPLLLARLLRGVPLLLARLLRGVPLLLARLLRGVPLLLARLLLPAPLSVLPLVPELGEALALELRDAPLLACLPRLRRVDALERSDVPDPFAEDDEERLRLLVLPDVPRSVAAAMVTS